MKYLSLLFILVACGAQTENGHEQISSAVDAYLCSGAAEDFAMEWVASFCESWKLKIKHLI